MQLLVTPLPSHTAGAIDSDNKTLPTLDGKRAMPPS